MNPKTARIKIAVRTNSKYGKNSESDMDVLTGCKRLINEASRAHGGMSSQCLWRYGCDPKGVSATYHPWTENNLPEKQIARGKWKDRYRKGGESSKEPKPKGKIGKDARMVGI